jgi:hypothetical protein
MDPPADDERRIVVTAAVLERLAADQAARTGRRPDDAQLRLLVQRSIDEEVLYREALRLGLDRKDPIVRRRLVQKMEFLSQDLRGTDEPTDAELRAWLEANAESFRIPARVRIRHAWYSRDARGERARDDAQQALDELRTRGADGPGPVGDAFLAGHSLPLRTESEVRAVFGGELPAAAMAAPPGEWVGPVQSAYGWHLIHVEERTPERAAELVEVRGRVRRALVEERRSSANRAQLDDLRARYEVVIEPMSSTTSPEVAASASGEAP